MREEASGTRLKQTRKTSNCSEQYLRRWKNQENIFRNQRRGVHIKEILTNNNIQAKEKVISPLDLACEEILVKVGSLSDVGKEIKLFG